MSLTSLGFYSGYIWFALAVITAAAACLAGTRAAFVFVATALLMALSAAVVDLNLGRQLLLFLAIIAITGVIYLRYIWVPVPDTATAHMRHRARSTLGVKTSLLRTVKAGKSKVQVGKAIWTVRCEQKLPAGRLVEVIGWHGRELEVAAVALPAQSMA